MRASFTEPPDARGSELAVFNAAGERVDTGPTTASDEENGIRVALKEIGEGGYTVAWTVLSTIDGHTTRGSFVFAVGNAPLPEAVDVGEPSAPPQPLEIAGRAASFGGMVLLLGAAIFGLVIRATPSGPEARREQLLFAAGGALVVAGAVALLLEQGGRAPPRFTALLGLRGIGGVAVLASAAAFASAARLRIVALGAGVASALSATLVSHAAASGSPVEVALDLAHIVAASAWAGGVVAMVAVLLPSASRMEPVDLGRIVGRFSTLAAGLVALLVATGTVQSFARLDLVQDLWETPYGLALLAKIALLALALALGALNLLVWGPRLRKRASVDRSRRRLALGTTGESVAFGGIILATALLTAFAPPAQASGAAYEETHHAGGLRMQLLLASSSPGQNRYVLRVQEGLAPVTDARVVFRFTMIEHDMGENELLAAERGPGEYVASGNATAMFGTWRIEAIVRRAGELDVRTTFTAPISAATGPGAVAKAIAAPPYTLVVFVDPAQPVSGAPLTLHVVVVDRSGDPALGKLVTATFRQAAAFNVVAREISTGRYEARVDALEAGPVTTTIAIGAEATAEYVFEVAR